MTPSPTVGTAVASPDETTLQSAQLPAPLMHACNLEQLEEVLSSGMCRSSFPFISDRETRTTVLHAADLVCRHALGGAMICVATKDAFRRTFRLGDADGPGPSIQVSDGGYMTKRLRGTHISDESFVEAFRAFTLHSGDDRWPEDYPDPDARGQPKDGAFLLSTEGYRLKCAAKLLGLAPAGRWTSVGTKHEAALACAAAVADCVVLVRSDGGSVHLIQKSHGDMHVYELH